MQQMLKSLECDYQVLKKAARIVRNDIFSSNGFSFNGSFPQGCQQGVSAYDSQATGDDVT